MNQNKKKEHLYFVWLIFPPVNCLNAKIIKTCVKILIKQEWFWHRINQTDFSANNYCLTWKRNEHSHIETPFVLFTTHEITSDKKVKMPSVCYPPQLLNCSIIHYWYGRKKEKKNRISKTKINGADTSAQMRKRFRTQIHWRDCLFGRGKK